MMLPVGFCKVDVKLDDNGVTFPCMMVSGHLAYSVDGEKTRKKDRVRPLASWFMFVKGEVRTMAPTTQESKENLEKKTKWNWKFWNL